MARCSTPCIGAVRDEVTLAAATGTGKTIWEHTENAAFSSGMAMENGPGPHATPLGHRRRSVFAVGILAHLVCLDKKLPAR
jgi:hypothetical protein